MKNVDFGKMRAEASASEKKEEEKNEKEMIKKNFSIDRHSRRAEWNTFKRVFNSNKR